MASSLTSTPDGGIEHLDRQHAGHTELRGDAQRDLLGRDRVVGDQSPARDLAADPVDLHGLHDRVGGRLPVRAARDQGRQLAGEADPLLGQQRTRPPRASPLAVGRDATSQTPLPS